MEFAWRFWNMGKTRHDWHTKVTFAETLTATEPDMWARPVVRGYVRCDQHEECSVCGETKHHRSCVCDASYAEHCAIYLDWRLDDESKTT